MFQWLKSFHLFVITYIFKIFIFRISLKKPCKLGVNLNLNTRIFSKSSLLMQSKCQVVNFKFTGWSSRWNLKITMTRWRSIAVQWSNKWYTIDPICKLHIISLNFRSNLDLMVWQICAVGFGIPYNYKSAYFKLCPFVHLQ